MHKSSYDNMSSFVAKYLSELGTKRLEILDVGSSNINGSYRDIFNKPAWKYVGLDVHEGKNVDIVVKNIYDWKEIKSGTFDLVISGQAFEHIEYFWATMFEIARVLKQEGYCCIIAPSSGVEHKFPVDCWRFLPDGFKSLTGYVGLETLESFCRDDALKYEDGSNMWRDTVLICRKPKMSIKQKAIFSLSNYLTKLTMKMMRLNRRSVEG